MIEKYGIVAFEREGTIQIRCDRHDCARLSSQFRCKFYVGFCFSADGNYDEMFSPCDPGLLR